MITPPSGVILVIRTDDATQALNAARGAASGGIDGVEITLTVPGAIDVIAELRDVGVPLGVGTVLSPEFVAPAVAAGASFVVAPDTNPAVIDAAHAHGVSVVPGAMTPTEIQNAVRLGADAVKLFPAGLLGGPAFLQELRGPLPLPNFVISGGVTAQSAPAYFAAGASAVCVGRSIYSAEALQRGDIAELAALTRAFMLDARR